MRIILVFWGPSLHLRICRLLTSDSDVLKINIYNCSRPILWVYGNAVDPFYGSTAIINVSILQLWHNICSPAAKGGDLKFSVTVFFFAAYLSLWST